MVREEQNGGARGRESAGPTEIPAPGWRDILLRTKDQVSNDNVALVSAGVAFYGLLALFPAVTAIVSIYGLVADPAQVERQLDAVSGLMPEGASALLRGQMTKVAGGGTGTLSLAAGGSILFALWSATKGTKAFITAMNIAYDEDEARGFFKLNLVALALTLFVVLLAVLIVGGVVVVPPVLTALGIGQATDWAISVLRWPLIVVVFIGGLAMFYRFAPSRDRPRWRWVSPGSIAAALLWLVAAIAFSIYVRNFGSYNETYGSLGAVIAMMIWLWLSAFVVIMGAELNAEIERQTRRDTTAGDEKPLGRRGAFAADTVGETP